MGRPKKPNSRTFLCNLDIMTYYRVIRILDKLGTKHSQNVKFIRKLLSNALDDYEKRIGLDRMKPSDVPPELSYIFEPDDGIIMF